MKAKTLSTTLRAFATAAATILPGFAHAQSHHSITDIAEELAASFNVSLTADGLIGLALFGAFTLVAVPTIIAKHQGGNAYAADVCKQTGLAVMLLPTVLGTLAGLILYGRAVVPLLFNTAANEGE